MHLTAAGIRFTGRRINQRPFAYGDMLGIPGVELGLQTQTAQALNQLYCRLVGSGFQPGVFVPGGFHACYFDRVTWFTVMKAGTLALLTPLVITHRVATATYDCAP
jgi:hypothetical protein